MEVGRLRKESKLSFRDILTHLRFHRKRSNLFSAGKVIEKIPFFFSYFSFRGSNLKKLGEERKINDVKIPHSRRVTFVPPSFFISELKKKNYLTWFLAEKHLNFISLNTCRTSSIPSSLLSPCSYMFLPAHFGIFMDPTCPIAECLRHSRCHLGNMARMLSDLTLFHVFSTNWCFVPSQQAAHRMSKKKCIKYLHSRVRFVQKNIPLLLCLFSLPFGQYSQLVP